MIYQKIRKLGSCNLKIETILKIASVKYRTFFRPRKLSEFEKAHDAFEILHKISSLKNLNACRLSRHFPFKFMIPVTILLFSACENKNYAPPISDETQKSPFIMIDYAGHHLSSDDAYPLIAAIESDSSESIPDFAWPSVDLENGVPCLKSMNSAYHGSESGLRFTLCDPSMDHAGIKNVLDQILNTDATAYPEASKNGLTLEVMTSSQIREAYGNIIFSIDGGLSDILQKKNLKGSEIHISYKNNFSAPDEYSLFRKFPSLFFHVAVTDEKALFLFEIPGDANRFLTISHSNREIYKSIKSYVKKIPGINKSLIEKSKELSATHIPFVISEIFFGKQGKSGDEFIELSNPNTETSIQNFRIVFDENTSYEKQILLLPESVMLLQRSSDDEIRFQNEVSFLPAGGESFDFSLSYFQKGGLSEFRTANSESADLALNPMTHLHPSLHCLSGAIPCGSPGVHPDLITDIIRKEKMKDAEFQPLKDCSINDFELSEINPFGIHAEKEGEIINPSGKFVEVISADECKNNHIIFLYDTIAMDTGFRNIGRGEFLLFAASRNYFETQNIYVNSSIRSIKPDGEILALSLLTGGKKILKRQLPSNHIFIYGYPDNSTLKKVHSLTIRGESIDFHAANSSGLRPDIADEHSMSPGKKNPFPGSFPGFRIQEIYPAGSRDSGGKSVPGDEFIEFMRDESITDDASLILEINGMNSGSKNIYQFPRPESSDIFALIAENPVCFNFSNSVFRARSFHLRNEPSQYLLRGLSGEITDQITVTDETYSLMDAGIRRSLIRIFPENAITVSDINDSPLCPGMNFADPGRIDHFSPFLKQTHSDIHSAEYSLISENTSETIHLFQGRDIFNPDKDAFVTASRGEIMIINPDQASAGNRILSGIKIADGIRVYEDEFFVPGPLLFIQSVSPTPAGNDVEWIRICSTEGISVAQSAGGLYIKDSSSADKIVPYLSRFSKMPEGFLLDGSTLALDPKSCAILVDPDFDSSTGQVFPENENDSVLWTVESTQTIGNGLASGEGFYIYRKEADQSISPLCSFGKPDTHSPYSIFTISGERIERASESIKDQKSNFRIIK